MQLMKVSKNKLIFTIAIVTIITVYFFNSKQTLYGNDKSSIEQVIRSIEGYKNESIEILDIKDINNDRLVGFLSNNHPAYIQFSKDRNGNYKWTNIEKRMGSSFATFLINVKNGELAVLKFMIVANQENEVAKMQLGVNDKVIEREFNVNKKSVYWIDLTKEKEFHFTYKYFDKEGNRIRDN